MSVKMKATHPVHISSIGLIGGGETFAVSEEDAAKLEEGGHAERVGEGDSVEADAGSADAGQATNAEAESNAAEAPKAEENAPVEAPTEEAAPTVEASGDASIPRVE
jgi:hypothetical protein